MPEGNSKVWEQTLRDPDEQVLDLFAEVWSICRDKFHRNREFVSDEQVLKVLAKIQPKYHGKVKEEDLITAYLVAHAEKHRRKHGNKRLVLDSQVKLLDIDDQDELITKGILDIKVRICLNGKIDELIYECKRLNVTFPSGKWESLAGSYVKQGMMRFVSQQYADDAKLGGMLGYVLDGDIARAEQKVHDAIQAHHQDLALIPPDIESLIAISIFSRFRTRHQRSNAPDIELRHCLLPL